MHFFKKRPDLPAFARGKVGQNGGRDERDEDGHDEKRVAQCCKRVIFPVKEIDIGEQKYAENGKNVRAELQNLGSDEQNAKLFFHEGAHVNVKG